MKKIAILLSLTIISAFLIRALQHKRVPVYHFDKEAKFSDSNFLPVTQQFFQVRLDTGMKTHRISAMNCIDTNTIIIVNKENKVFVCNRNLQKVQEFNSVNTPELQLISPISVVRVNSHEFNIYDLTLDKLFNFISGANKIWKFKKSIQLPKELTGLASIEMIDDSVGIASSVNNVNGRLLKFTLKPYPRILKYFGEKIAIDGNSQYVTGQAYWSCSTHDSQAKRSFIGYHYTDLFEAYNDYGKLLFRLHGPEGFDPSYHTLGSPDNQRFVLDKNSKTAYLSICCDHNFVYLLYSGQNSLTPTTLPINNPQKVYVFNTNGVPFKAFTVNITSDIREMILDKFNNRLFLNCFSEKDGQSIYFIPTKMIGNNFSVNIESNAQLRQNIQR